MPFIYVPLNVIGFVLFYIASVAAFGPDSFTTVNMLTVLYANLIKNGK